MTFYTFAKFLEKLETTASRIEMTQQLAALYQQLAAEENQTQIKAAVYLMQGRLVPLYESLEFNLSTKMLQRALAKLLQKHQEKSETVQPKQTNLFGEQDDQYFLKTVKAQFKHNGDLGLAVEALLNGLGWSATQKLNISETFIILQHIAREEGTGSQERKVSQLVVLLEKVTPLSARYITRIILGKLRLGFSTMTLLDALSWAVQGDKSARLQLEEAYNKRADVGQLAQVYLAAADEESRQQVLANYAVVNGVPVVPALAQRLNTTAAVIEKMGQVLVEPKYDGLRIQIHFQRGQGDQSAVTKAYTRSLDDVTHMLPELAEAPQALHCESCILDGEAIGFDPKSGELVSFQKTITRRRKHEVADHAASVPLRFYVFDILEMDGQSLVDTPLIERKKKLAQAVSKHLNFESTPFLKTAQASVLKKYHQQQLAAGLEGAIFKKVASCYRGGRKGWRWVKMKEVEGERGKLNDTLDVIVMGYYAGKGKRAEFGIGAILVGVLDQKQEVIKTLTKIGTGLTDEQLQLMKAKLDAVAATQPPSIYQVPATLEPDVWAQPAVVIEVAADEITQSPTHTAGVALRFPRLVAFRTDKNWQTATTLAELKQIEVK